MPASGCAALVERHATGVYLGSLTLLIGLLVGLLVLAVVADGAGAAMVALTALLAFIPASELALSVLNWDITHLFEPRLLPKIDLSQGIPAEAQTIVVVPVLFSDLATIETLDR